MRLTGTLPVQGDTIKINSCSCPEASCLVAPGGTTQVSGLSISTGAVMTIPAGATLEVDGPFTNEGTILIDGQLIVNVGLENSVFNRGEVDCRNGGTLSIME